MTRWSVYALIVYGLFYFSEGKPCPEKSRPHKSRCDVYYKCMQLPSEVHVWVPANCEEGLVYEHSIGLCVLPEDNWECTLGDAQPATKKAAHLRLKTTSEPAMDIVSNAEDDEGEIQSYKDDGNVEIVMDGSLSSEEDDDENDGEEVELQAKQNSEEEEEEENDAESSGNGKLEELAELDSVIEAENNEIVTESTSIKAQALTPQFRLDDAAALDSSTESTTAATTTSKIDPNLTMHLQRLTQLIDGLKQKQQEQDSKGPTELRPDQLNAFLAHFNIKTQSNDDIYQPTPISSTTTPKPPTTTTTPATQPSKSLIERLKPSRNKTLLQEHLSNLKPETKLLLTTYPKRYGHQDYSNAQIIVNRPEGSVTFSLPQHDQHSQQPYFSESYSANQPKISEETLKTVLELSKQMIASQNVPKVIPNPAYYQQPILQPVIFTGPTAQTQPFAAYFTAQGQSLQQQGSNGSQRPLYGQKPTTTTIIHNNVIPMHYTNPGEKHPLDSYGQSLLYPPHSEAHASFTTIRPQIASSTTVSTYAAAEYPAQLSTTFAPDISVTTARPFEVHPTAATIAEFYTPSPHLGDHNANSVFQASLSNYGPTVPSYSNMPRPMYTPTIRPSHYGNPQRPLNQNSLFPPSMNPNSVSIRPNSQKVESMEDVLDDGTGYLSAGSSFAHSHAQQAPSFGYGNTQESPDFSNSQHNYMPRPPTTASSSSSNSFLNNLGYPGYTSSHTADGSQLVNFGGNFISFEAFQNTIMPMLGSGGSQSPLSGLNNIEVINCSPGVRQANATDCTRYYVCSKRKGNEPSKVYSYSCPPYTGFNAQARICDARTYALCRATDFRPSYTVAENKRLYLEALQAMQENKRRQEQAIKAQAMAQMLQQYNQMGGQGPSIHENGHQNQQLDSNEQQMLSSYMQQAAAMSVASTTQRPQGNLNFGGGISISSNGNIGISSSSSSSGKKRKYYCKEGDKIADQTSISNYFVCYKNAQGQMKGHKMSCSKGLLFCPKTTMCTTAARCG